MRRGAIDGVDCRKAFHDATLETFVLQGTGRLDPGAGIPDTAPVCKGE
jgi:hypothetical protein